MSNDKAPAAAPATNATRLREVRLRLGEVHWNGARTISHVTTDRSTVTISGTHVLHVDELSLHPAGVLLRVDGEAWIIPHVRVETYRLA